MRGPTLRLSSPYVRSLNYTDGYDAKLIAEHVKRRGVKRLGLVGMAQINHVIVDYLRQETGAELVDAHQNGGSNQRAQEPGGDGDHSVKPQPCMMK